MSYMSTTIDISRFNGAVLDQGSYGTCVQNALSSSISNLMKQAGKDDEPISRMWAYNQHRQVIGSGDRDIGSVAKIVLEQGVSKGFMQEEDFAYTDSNYFVRPTQQDFVEAANHKLVSFTSIPMEQSYTSLVTAIKGMLIQGKTVMMTLAIEPWFDSQYGVPINQQIGHGHGEIRGYHAVLIDSFDDFMNVVPANQYYYQGGFEFSNSWGTGFGENGKGTIDYGQFRTPSNITGLFTINGYEDVNTEWTTARKSVAMEYATLLHRPAEIGAMDYWASIHNMGYSDAQVADILINSVEGVALYGNDTHSEFVNDLYQSILGRNVDVSGEAYWVGLLNSGYTRGTVYDALSDMIMAPNGEAQARDYLMNKQNLSAYVSIARQWDGTAGNYEVVQAIANVTSDANMIEIIKIGLPSDLNVGD